MPPPTPSSLTPPCSRTEIRESPRPTCVHACWQTLDVQALERERYAAVLSDDERQRASQFRFLRDSHRYIVRRGRLRELLARDLGCLPRQVPLSCNRFGKPRIDGADIDFNLSHSAGLALYVIAHQLDIGCDIEWRVPGLVGPAVAELFFSPLEVTTLAGLPLEQRDEAFFNCWTRKEAYLKALGLGLSIPLDSFAVSLAPGEPAALLQSRHESDVGRWSLASFAPAPGLHVAVAARGPWQLATMGLVPDPAPPGRS